MILFSTDFHELHSEFIRKLQERNAHFCTILPTQIIKKDVKRFSQAWGKNQLVRIQPRKPKVWIETIREHDSPSNHTRDKFSTPFFLPIIDFINKMYCWLSINLLSSVVAQLNDRNTLSKNSTLPLIFRKNQGPLLSLPQPPSRCNAYVKAFEIWSFSLRSMHFHLFEKM